MTLMQVIYSPKCHRVAVNLSVVVIQQWSSLRIIKNLSTRSMSSTFSATKSRILSNPTTLTSSNTTTIVPIKHWSQACHETVLSSNDQHHSLQLSLAGGAENGEFVYLNESVSILKNKPFLTIIKGSKIDCEEILLDIDQHSVAGCTLTDVERLIEQRSANGRSIQLQTVKSGKSTVFFPFRYRN